MLSLLLPIAPSSLHSLVPIGFACVMSNVADMVSFSPMSTGFLLTRVQPWVSFMSDWFE